jgi:hypothetical protein
MPGRLAAARITTLSIVGVLLLTLPASLAALEQEPARGQPHLEEPFPPPNLEDDLQPSVDGLPGQSHEKGSSRLFVPLYAQYAGLQMLDAHLTLKGLEAGHVERNPLIGGVAGNPAVFLGLKAATAATTVYLAERLRKKNRAAAIGLMIGLNCTYTAIIIHNARVVGR